MLNHEQMLPVKIRSMRQMGELLDAEDLILVEFEEAIGELYEIWEGLKEELVNEPWLKEKLSVLTGSDVTVIGDADHLAVDISMDVSALGEIPLEQVRSFLQNWLPAHLRFQLELVRGYRLWNPEEFWLSSVVIGMRVPFFKVRLLDGRWFLDGTIRLDSIEKPDRYGICIRIKNKAELPIYHSGAIRKKDWWLLDGAYTLDGSRRLDAEMTEEEW